MDQDHLEFLRIENKKLRGKHNELESNLTEEKEMVKYLHGVIKNYQQLLKSPETTRHLKTASLKKVRRSSSARRLASEKDVDELFVKNFIEMSGVHSKTDVKRKEQGFVPNDSTHSVVLDTSNCENTDRINKVRRSSSARLLASEKDVGELFVKNFIEMGSGHSRTDVKRKEHGFVPNNNSRLVVLDNSNSSCENTDRINNNSQVSDETLSAIECKKAECTPDTEKLFWDAENQHSCHSQGNTIPVGTLPQSGTSPKYNREHVLQEMAQMLDSMMQKTTILEKSLKQKDKHLTKMERRYEYLESIALGEESEWL